MNPPSELPLRPLGTGELLDRALTVFRRQFRELFKISLLFQLVMHGVTKAFELLAFAHFPILVQPRAITAGTGLEAYRGQLVWALPSIVVYVALSILVWQLSVAAVSAPAGGELSAKPIRAADAWHRLRPHLAALLGTLGLELLVIGVNTALGALPFALGLAVALRAPSPATLALFALGAGLSILGMLGLFLVALLRYILVPSVVVVEGRRGWGALKRAAELMRGRSVDAFWDYPKIRGSLVVLVLGLVSNAVLIVASGPRSMLLLSSGGANPNAWALLVIELLELVAYTAVAPFGMATLALFYLDLRVRREGVDLALATERMAKAA